jgi:hypothetical protein
MDWTEAKVARAIAFQVFDRRCIVLCPNCKWTGNELDLLGITMNGRIIDIEIKVSRADFLRDRSKDKWFRSYDWKRDQPVVGPDGRARYIGPRIDWPERVWKHYYVLPASVWKPDLLKHISPMSGVLLLSCPAWDTRQESIRVRSVRRATPCRAADRLKPEAVLDIARLCNLRMWSALEKAGASHEPHTRRIDQQQ